MKILSWMQSKIQGKTVSAAKKSNPFPSTVTLDHHVGPQDSTVESIDWWPASGLLAIGTFGLNKNLQKQDGQYQKDAQVSQNIFSTLPPEEASEISEKLFSIEDFDDEQVLGSSDMKHDPEEDEDSSYHLRGVERSTSFALSRGIKNKDGSCTKKSFSIIFKKMYNRSFSQSPGLNHSLPESRMDKILRAILHKKIYPQSSSATVKKCLKNKSATAAEVNSKWIKTDSDYIVLEM